MKSHRTSTTTMFALAAAALALWSTSDTGITAQAQRNQAMQVIEDAAAALGGKARILAVKTLTIVAYATNPNIGQAMTPEAEPLWWMIPDYKRSIDLEHERMELSMTRRPAFPAVFDANGGGGQRLDGDLVYNAGRGGAGGGAAAAAALGRGAGGGVPAGGPPAAAGGGAPGAGGAGPAGGGRGGGQIGGQAARDLRLDMLRHPLTLVRAALDPAAKVFNVRQSGSQRSVDITTAKDDTLTLTIDALNRPVSIRTAVSHNILGDTERIITFDSYENLNGVLLPKRFVQKFDRWVEYEIGVMKNTLDADLSALAAPEAVRGAAQAQAASATQRGAAPNPGPANAAPLNMEQVAKGIWYGNASLIIEFADHVALIEVQNDAKLYSLLAKAKELVPGKPVTQAIVSHHHFDHAGGLRTAVAEELTIIAQKVNEPWFREVVARKHTIDPDPLARSPKPLKIITFEDSYTIKDATMEMTLYHLRGSTHSDGILMAYFPRERFLVEADHWYGPPGQIKPHMRSLHDDIEARQLKVDRMAVLHGNGVYAVAEFEKSYADWCCRNETTTSYVPPAPQR